MRCIFLYPVMYIIHGISFDCLDKMAFIIPEAMENVCILTRRYSPDLQYWIVEEIKYSLFMILNNSISARPHDYWYLTSFSSHPSPTTTIWNPKREEKTMHTCSKMAIKL